MVSVGCKKWSTVPQAPLDWWQKMMDLRTYAKWNPISDLDSESPKCLGMSLGQSPRFVLLKIIITDRILSLFVKNPLTICVAISTVSTKSQWSDLFIALCNIYSDVWRVLRGDSLQYESSYKDDAIDIDIYLHALLMHEMKEFQISVFMKRTKPSHFFIEFAIST